MSDALSNEIQSFSAKRSSLRDKLKKRREALGSILSGVQATEDPTPKEPQSLSTKQQDNEVAKRLPTPPPPPAVVKEPKAAAGDDLMSLLSAPSAKEKADQEKREEILELLGKPTAKERSLIDSFKSSGGVQQFCTHSTKSECVKVFSSDHYIRCRGLV